MLLEEPYCWCCWCLDAGSTARAPDASCEVVVVVVIAAAIRLFRGSQNRQNGPLSAFLSPSLSQRGQDASLSSESSASEGVGKAQRERERESESSSLLCVCVCTNVSVDFSSSSPLYLSHSKLIPGAIRIIFLSHSFSQLLALAPPRARPSCHALQSSTR